MDKKGAISAYTIIWVGTVLFVLIPFYLVLNAIVQTGIDVSLDTNNLEDYLLLNRVFYSTNSFFYNDPYTGRTNLEIIDINKFNNENTLKNLFDEESNTNIALKIILGNDVQYYRKELYDFIEPIHAKSEKYDMATKNKVVLVRYPDGSKEEKILTVNLGFEK